jgi:murein DD-endopeptidase MepM/ murein hydrolase activator NlpD
LPTSAAAPTPAGTPAAGQGGQTVGIECVAPVLKRHPIDLAPYDSASGRAGDASFRRPLFLNRVYTEFGFVIPANTSSTGNDKPNPQPTYHAPMGTKVRSAVDGVVDKVADLWSTPTLGDVSVMVKPDGLAGRCYVVVEFEHVVKPTVRAGDRVTAGQVIAEVGPLNSQGSAGLGLVEFGILTGSPNGRPLHVCPYAYFEPSVRATQLAILGRLMADWEAYFGDANLYNEGAWAGGVTGCRSGPIEE